MIEMTNPLLKLAHLAAVVIFIVCCWLVAGYVLDTVLEIRQIETATPTTNTTAINNYYCNETDFHSEPLSHTGEPYSGHIHEIEPFPDVTPALWNDTRRESVGLPADGIGNNCCKHCTPTPTPTITEACEFPWWCPMKQPHPQQGGERR